MDRARRCGKGTYRGVLLTAKGKPVAVRAAIARVDGAESGELVIVAKLDVGTSRSDDDAGRDWDDLGLAFHRNPLPMWMYDCGSHRIIAVNDAALVAYGYTRRQFTGLTVDQLHPPRERERFGRELDRQLTADNPGRRSTHMRSGGQVFPVHVSANAIHLSTGAARVVTARDISDELAALDEARTARVELEALLTASVAAIAAAAEERDPYTGGHQRRVADLSVKLGERLGMSADRLKGLQLAASVHDIGKISVPGEILNHLGRLDPHALELIKAHSRIGHDILARIRFPWPVATTVLQHHERIDGTGYPDGLTAEHILLEAKVLAVADVVEAITAHRPYRPALGIEAGLAEISSGRGIRYDADCVDACVELFRSGAFSFDPRTLWSPGA